MCIRDRVYTLHFASREFMRNLRTKVSQAYNGRLDMAVQKVLDDGLRTKDIMSKGKKEVTTTDMGDAIISKLK